MPGGDASDAADLAAEAEQAGWDGFFVWDGIWSIDAWVSLTACATRHQRIKLGTMLTPLPRRKPWDVASQVATLDNLAGGRVILAVGLGADDDRWNLFEDIEDRRVRAEKLDEGLDLITGLWSGEPFSYQGRHYRARPTGMMVPPPPVQRPRPPIWVVGLWPAMKVDAPGRPVGRLAAELRAAGRRRDRATARGGARRWRAVAAAEAERDGAGRSAVRRDHRGHHAGDRRCREWSGRSPRPGPPGGWRRTGPSMPSVLVESCRRGCGPGRPDLSGLARRLVTRAGPPGS